MACGQLPAGLRVGGEVGGQLLPQGKGLNMGRLRLSQIAKTKPYATNALKAFSPDGSALCIVSGDGSEAFEVRDDLPKKLFVLLAKIGAASHLILDDVIGHHPQGGQHLVTGLLLGSTGLGFGGERLCLSRHARPELRVARLCQLALHVRGACPTSCR